MIHSAYAPIATTCSDIVHYAQMTQTLVTYALVTLHLNDIC